MSLAFDHHQDLVAVARQIHTKNFAERQVDPKVPRIDVSINDTACTVSDRNTGELLGFVSPAFTKMSAETWLGWHEWPRMMGAK